MIIIGVDFHPEFQQIASVDTDTGEFEEKRLAHRAEAENFYRGLAAMGQRHTICDGPVLGSAMLREASWSRSNSSWGMSQFKRPNDILAASSGFDLPSMIALALSRILEWGVGLWKVCRPSTNRLRPDHSAINAGDSRPSRERHKAWREPRLRSPKRVPLGE
jgi:hypothetical protein